MRTKAAATGLWCDVDWRSVYVLFAALAGTAGCSDTAPPKPSPTQSASDPPPPVSTATATVADLHAQPDPPPGWLPQPVPASSRAQKSVWFSPDGRTAYGVIFFPLFLPVNRQIALAGFLTEMQKREGRAKLLSKQMDDPADAVRFVAEMPTYTMYGKLMVDGRSGWVFFASTTNGQPVMPDELAAAERAREGTTTIK